MPLAKGKDWKTISRNVQKLMHEKYSQRQAVAIATHALARSASVHTAGKQKPKWWRKKP